MKFYWELKGISKIERRRYVAQMDTVKKDEWDHNSDWKVEDLINYVEIGTKKLNVGQKCTRRSMGKK